MARNPGAERGHLFLRAPAGGGEVGADVGAGEGAASAPHGAQHRAGAVARRRLLVERDEIVIVVAPPWSSPGRVALPVPFAIFIVTLP